MTPSLLFRPDEIDRIKRTLVRPEFAQFWSPCCAADLATDERFLRDEIKLDNPRPPDPVSYR